MKTESAKLPGPAITGLNHRSVEHLAPATAIPLPLKLNPQPTMGCQMLVSFGAVGNSKG